MIVGRETELAQIARFLQGPPGVLLFEGEPGIGKSTLLAEAVERGQDAGHRVLQARAEELFASRPFALLADALGADGADGSERDLVAAAGECWAGAEPDAGPSDAIPTLVDLSLDRLEAETARQPVLLVLDDLHWADAASLLVLGPLARRALPLGVRLALAFRSSPRPQPLGRLLEVGAALGAETIRLEPLDRDAVDELLELELGGRADTTLLALARQAGGNPFLLRELVASQTTPVGTAGPASGSLDLPEGVREAVLRRMRVVFPGGDLLLRVAAVLGPRVRIDDLAAVSGRSVIEVADTVTEAVRAGFLEEDEHGLAFHHELVRSALLEDMPAAVRRSLHREAATILDARGAPVEIIAGHLLEGGEPGDTVVISRLREIAAEQAPAVAAALLVPAFERCGERDPQQPALALEAISCLLDSGRPAEGAALARDVLTGALADPVIEHEIRARLSRALFASGQPAEAVDAWLRRDRSLVIRPRPGEAAELALARLFAGDLAGAEDEATAALDSPDAEPEQATAHAVLAWVRAAAFDFDAALDHANHAVERAAEQATPVLRHTPALVRGVVLDGMADNDGAEAAFAAAEQAATADGIDVMLPPLYALRAVHAYRLGRWDDAVTDAEVVRAAGADTGMNLADNWAAAITALVCIDRDGPAEAESILDRRTAPSVRLGQDWVALARSRLLGARGDEQAALDLLGAVLEMALTTGSRATLVLLGPDVARRAVRLGDRNRLAWLLDAAGTVPSAAPGVHRAARMLVEALAEGDADVAEDAGRLLLAAGWMADGMRALGDAALLAVGDPDRARRLAREVSTLADGLGASSYRDRLRADLRAAGIRFRAPSPSARARTGWDALTETERRVVALVAQGLTNGAIAERLVVSRRTVESHLVRVYAKVGVTSRVELAVQAAARA